MSHGLIITKLWFWWQQWCI